MGTLAGWDLDRLILVIQNFNKMKKYNIPEEICDGNCGAEYDFNKMEAEFIKACPDYKENIVEGSTNKALEFAALVAYVMCIEISTRNQPGMDRRWKFRITEKLGDENKESAVFVGTFLFSAPPRNALLYKNHQMVLTMQQASLLAVTVLTKAVDFCLTKNCILLTPLAGAIFLKNDIKKITEEVNWVSDEVYTDGRIIKVILQSCQCGGHYLDYSEAHVAVAVALRITQDAYYKVRKSTILNTFQQYMAVGKVFDNELYKIYCKYATGKEVPSEYTLDNLYKTQEISQMQKDFVCGPDLPSPNTLRNQHLERLMDQTLEEWRNDDSISLFKNNPSHFFEKLFQVPHLKSYHTTIKSARNMMDLIDTKTAGKLVSKMLMTMRGVNILSLDAYMNGVMLGLSIDNEKPVIKQLECMEDSADSPTNFSDSIKMVRTLAKQIRKAKSEIDYILSKAEEINEKSYAK